MKKILGLFFFLGLALPALASAHQPRIVLSHDSVVIDPETSKAYYGQLKGTPDMFTIQASAPFSLYVNILVPYIEGQKKDVVATITKDGMPVAILDGTQFTWTKMFEPFDYDTYWAGPEYKAQADAGTYTVVVTSGENDSKYSLAIGEAENFNVKETLNALTLVPQLKGSFFNESPISFILSPFGWGLIVVFYILAGLVGLTYRFILRKTARKSVYKVSRNIGTWDRLLRLAIGVALLLWAITTTWSMILIFFSGFAVFEALFSWCGLYAALGRNTCPTE